MDDQPDRWLRERARELRKMPWEAENLLWVRIRARRLGGFRFRRQHVIGRFIVDFYCAEKRMAVEVDGVGHDPAADDRRDRLLAAAGIAVIRFSTYEVFTDLAGCLDALSIALRSRQSFGRSRRRTPSALDPG